MPIMPFIGVRISCDMRDRNVVLDRLSSSLCARRSAYCSIRPHSPVVRLKQNRSYPSSSPRVTFICTHSPFFVRRTVSNGCAPSHARYFSRQKRLSARRSALRFLSAYSRSPPAESAHPAFPANPLCAFLHLLNSIFTLFYIFHPVDTYISIYT